MLHEQPIRKFCVFISSVTNEFQDVRAALWKQTFKAGHIPLLMEYEAADGQTIVSTIEQSIHQADIFVILLGEHYGSLIDFDTLTSYVQHEVEIARKRGLPILAFHVSSSGKTSPPPSNDVERRLDERYRELLASVYATTHVRRVQMDPDQEYAAIRAEYGVALSRLARRLNHGGWISADIYDQRADLIELGKAVSRSPFFRRFVERLNSFTTLSERTTSHPEEKEAIADFFWEQFLPRIQLRGISRLFFESGSTIAYLSERFIKQLRQPWVRSSAGKFIIETNNILTYLDFLLVEPHSDPIDVRLYPPAPAEEYYGATFGDFTSLVAMYPPVEGYRLPADAIALVRSQTNEIRKRYKSRGIVLMTASGLEMNRDHKFFGPHVGSYYNALFKRCLLGSDAPVVMFLEGSKIRRPFIMGQCYPVCAATGSSSWSQICRTKPMAIITDSLSEEDLNTKKQLLQSLGLDQLLEGKGNRTNYRVVIAFNDSFAGRFL